MKFIINKSVGRTSTLYLCVLYFLISIFYLLILSPNSTFYWDADDYFWKLSAAFISDGKFNLLNYKESLRGLMFPLWNLVLIKFATFIKQDPVDIYKIFSALYTF